MEFDLSLIVNSLPLLLKGAGLTLEITALAVGLGLIIGLFLGLAQLSKIPSSVGPPSLRRRDPRHAASDPDLHHLLRPAEHHR